MMVQMNVADEYMCILIADCIIIFPFHMYTVLVQSIILVLTIDTIFCQVK